MIDGLSSFSVLAFLFNELFLLQSDAGLSVVIYQDLFWCGMCSLLALRAVTNPANSADPSHIMIIKNAIFLCLCYATLAVHYIVGLYLISLGLILMVLYFANFFINANEGRFTDFINSVMQFKTAVDDGKVL